ncbi:MAG: hypothetical protein R8K20_08560 [Gallionellaceae bacterium]
MRISASLVLLLSFVSFPSFALEKFKSEQVAQQHCPEDTVVWLNLRSGRVHAKGKKWYGRTHVGAFVCNKEVAKTSKRLQQSYVSKKNKWKKLLIDEDTTLYVDLTTISKRAATVKMLAMGDLKKKATLSDGKQFLSWKTQYEFDCSGKRSRTLAASMHSGSMGAGEITNKLDFASPEWKAIPPNCNGERLWEFACTSKHP